MPLIPSTMNEQTSSAAATQSGNPTEHWTNLLVGKTLGDKTDQTTFDKKELPQKHRVLEPDSFTTMDFVEDRLNVHLAQDGTVAKVSHG